MYNLKPPVAELKFIGSEPSWTDPVLPEKYEYELGKGLNWYSYVADKKDDRQFLIDWFKTNGTKDQLSTLQKIPDKYLPGTYAHCARMAMRGFPLSDHHKEKIWLRVQEESTRKAEEDDTIKPAVIKVQPTIPLAIDYIKAVVCDQIEALIADEKTIPIETLLLEFRVLNNHHSACCKKVQEIRAEYAELQENRKKKNLTDWEAQLVEGYRHLDNKTVKEIIKLLDGYIEDLTKLQIKKSVGKIRKKKPTDKRKIVRGLKYLVKDTTLNISSEDPTTLINCTEVYVYDTKTRKLSNYVAEYPGGITVKGASLIGFSETKSSSKTMRKPEQQVPEFANKKRKGDITTWYKDIKSKGTVRPRLTATTLILKVF